MLLVCNRRRNGALDWSPPGGVIDEGELLIEGLGREVIEETGLSVVRWHGPIYEIEATAPEMGWHLRVEAHLALGCSGSLVVDDPDGIVIGAEYASPDRCEELMAGAPRWVSEPLLGYLAAPDGGPQRYAYRISGDRSAPVVERTDPS